MSVSQYELQRYHKVVEEEAKRRHVKSADMKLYGARKLHLAAKGRTTGVKVCSWSPSSGKLEVQVHEEQYNEGTDFTIAKNPGEDIGFQIGDGHNCIAKSSPKKRNTCNAVAAGKSKEADVLLIDLGSFSEFSGECRRRKLKRTGVCTRSITAKSTEKELEGFCPEEEMRRAESAKNVDKECNVSLKNGKRPMESFVPWKKPSLLRREGGKSSSVKSITSAREKTNEMSMSRRSWSPKSPPIPSSAPVLGADGENDTRGSAKRQSRKSSVSGHAAPIDGQTAVVRSQGRGRQFSHRGQEVSAALESSLKTQSTKSTRALQEEISSRNRERRFHALHGVRGREEHLPDRSGSLGRPQAGKTSAVAADGFDDEDGSGQEVGTHSAMEDEQEAVDVHEEQYGSNIGQTFTGRPQSRSDALGLYNDNVHDIVETENEDEEDGRHVLEEEGDQDAGDDRDVQDLLYRTDAERKKDRRQERALLDKEGERRKKEGLPRNFLLVDEKTKKPYSVGVGDWRKELMLLSRDLDPAIGNINNQPEGAVAEIADWIQRTWEYSSPVKFEYVKEVIARGVTLRRVELWKRIRNGEERPTGISDRTWRTLERQLDNPASIKKSENCRRANASRVNFGRTGPSGEVGVRQRLKRFLRRSPDPEEVRYEMARDKGYSGRHQREDTHVHVMHGSGRVHRLNMEEVQNSARYGNLQEGRSVDYDDEYETENASDEANVEVNACPRNGELVVSNAVASMSAEQISKHPFVLMMMQRLEALESKRTDAEVEDRGKDKEEVPAVGLQGGDGGGQRTQKDFQVAQHVQEVEEIDGTPRSRRQSKKTRRA